MNPIDFRNAKMKHLQWKMKIQGFIDGKETMTLEQAVNHTQCDLGKWYYSVGKKMYGKIPEMQLFEKYHERLHLLVFEIIQLKTENQYSDIFEKYGELTKMSDHIFECLDKAEKAINIVADQNLKKISI